MSTIDYTPLQQLLEAENWQEADKLTFEILLQLANRKDAGCLDAESVNSFSCKDLQEINELWLKYSEGRYSFTVQKGVWDRVSCKTVDDEIWTDFGWCVGWCGNDRKWLPYEEIGKSVFPPTGHFPVASRGYLALDLDMAGKVFIAFMEKLEECSRANFN
ncbi:MAG TPA: GUN4 domain-containing protein [Nostocaceae cyanobacterium]|nr:GUN4 domain-containing protein [Nostocaceae cyanobacterium]